MSALRSGLERVGLVLTMIATSAANAGASTASGTNPRLPPGLPGPPALHAPPGGDRPLSAPPGDRPRGLGGRGSVAGLIGMIDDVRMAQQAIVEEAVTSTGNENYWLSEMERSAQAVVKAGVPVDGERLADRR